MSCAFATMDISQTLLLMKKMQHAKRFSLHQICLRNCTLGHLHLVPSWNHCAFSQRDNGRQNL
jgi:hypothetical protein